MSLIIQSFFLVMNKTVSFHLATASEGFPALVTDEGFLPGVRHHVCLQVVDFLRADGTDCSLVTRMRRFVQSQVLRPRKLLVANVARKRLLS